MSQLPDHFAERIRSRDAIEGPEEPPSSPRPSVNVVIYTPSKNWVALDTKGASPQSAAEDKDKDSDDDFDDNVSVSSITRYVPLDYDYNGVEFEEVEVVPETTRRSSRVTPKHQSEVTTPQTRCSPKTSSASSNKFTPQRDSKGRFAKSKIEPSESRPLERSEGPEEELLAEALLPAKIKSSFLRPKETRILPPKALAKSPIASSSQLPAPAIPVPESKAIKNKAKKPLSKSPYFTPPISPSKFRKAKILKSEFEIIIEEAPKEPSYSQPQHPKTPKKENGESPSKATHKRHSPAGIISCIPFPPLSAPHFGLIQEKLAHDPFRLLIAVTFLIRTHGKHAIPVFYELMVKYPTPESLVAVDMEDIVPIIRHLGLQNQRANTYQMYAKIWLEDPPMKGKRYVVPGYPAKASGRGVRKDEILSDDDERDAWEIGHMTQGPYALDSWRIFCRDVLRGEAKGWNGEGSEKEGFQPEWMRVVPEDKELRAYLRWMWLKEGFEWDPFTGEKEVASEKLMRAAMEGKIAWDEKGGMRILDDLVDMENDVDMSQQ